MSDGGKGSAPRPFSVPKEEFNNNWEAIFGKKPSGGMTTEDAEKLGSAQKENSGDQSNWENTSLARLSQRFDSAILHQAHIAHLVEQRTSNAQVVSSNPTVGTKLCG